MRPDVRRAATATLGIAVILLAANAVRMSVDRARAQALPTVPSGAVVVPYTVVLSEVVVGTSGATKPGPSQTWALRSDGASALKIGDGEKSTRLLRFPDGTRVELSDWLRVKSTVRPCFRRLPTTARQRPRPISNHPSSVTPPVPTADAGSSNGSMRPTTGIACGER